MAEVTKVEVTKEYGAVRPTLFIGLGGTGKEVLLRLRRKLFTTLGVKKLPCLAYLWCDTDTRDVTAMGEPMDEIFQEVRFSDNEMVALLKTSVGTDLGKIFTNPGQFSYIHEWLYPQVESFGQQIANGAGNVRAVGRLTLFHNFATIRDRITTAATEALNVSSIAATQQLFMKRGWPVPDFVPQRRAVVVFSVVGGTGAGTFLDVGFILRYLQDTLMFDQVIGICVMPNIYFVERNDEQSVRCYANAYAALKELEFYMARRIDVEQETRAGAEARHATADFVVNWDGEREQRVQGPPFEVVYVLERNDDQGVGVSEKREFFKMVAESLYMDFMPGAFASRKRGNYADVVTLLAMPQESTVRVEGTALPQVFSRRYATFGLGKLEVPIEALKGACANQLASDISEFWTRQCENPDILGDVNRDMAEHQLTLDSLAGRFVSGWREGVRREAQRAVSSLAANPGEAKEPEIEQAKQALAAIEDRLIGAQGIGRLDSENNLPYRFTVDTKRVVDEVRESLMKWIGVCLEDPSRGPKGLLMVGGQAGSRKGYLQLMKERLNQTYVSDTSECMTRKQEALKYAESWRGKRDAAFAELKTAVTHPFVLPFGKREAVSIWTENLKKAEEQYIIRMAEVALYDRCRYVAGEAERFLNEKTVDLQSFLSAIEGLSSPFRAKKDALLRPGENVLFIQVYDEAEDWPRFYKLGDKDVSAQNEALAFLGKRTLHDVYDDWREEGTDHTKNDLWKYCEKRFTDDFDAHPRQVDLMRHPQMRGSEKLTMRAKQLVGAAMPRAQVSGGWGKLGQTKRRAYIGVTSDNNEDRQKFVQAVKNALQANDFSVNDILEQENFNKGEIYLYTVNYAFPLPRMPLVSTVCHSTYYSFYSDLRRNQVGAKTNRIPVHIDRRWEGRFDDLTSMTDDEALRHKEALEVMLFGPALGVVYRHKMKEMPGLAEFGYWRKELGITKKASWGNRKETLEALKNDGGMRKRFYDEIKKREGELDPDRLRAYLLALMYVSLTPGFAEGTVEHSLLVSRYTELEGIRQKKNVVLKDVPADKAADIVELWHWVQTESAGLLDIPEGCEIPVLKGLEPWVYKPGV